MRHACEGFQFRRRAIAHLLIRASPAAIALLLAGCPSGSSPPPPPNDDGTPPPVSATTFSKSYGGVGVDEARAAVPTNDGGFVFVGVRDADAGVGSDFVDPRAFAGGDVWISKLDANGNVEWQRAIGERAPSDGTRRRTFTSVRQTQDGGYVLAGTARDSEGGASAGAASGEDFWVAKLSAAGSQEWSRDYDSGAWTGFEFATAVSGRGSFADDRAIDIQVAPGGGYVIVGSSVANLLVGERTATGFAPPTTVARTFLDAESVYVLRLDAAGNPQWTRRLTDGQFAGEFSDHPNSAVSGQRGGLSPPALQVAADNGALIAYGEIARAPDAEASRERRLHVARLDSSGVLLWQQVDEDFDGSFSVSDVLQTDDVDPGTSRDGQRDDGFLIVASQFAQSVVLKLDRDGTLAWRRQFRDDGGEVALFAADQVCITEAATFCNYALVGFGSNGTVSGGLVLLVAEDGTPFDDPVVYPDTERMLDVVGIDGNNLLSMIADVGGGRARRMVSSVATQVVLDRSDDFEHHDVVQFGAGRGFLTLDTARQTFTRYIAATLATSAASRPEQTVELGATRSRSDVGIGVVEVAPNSYLVAGNTNSFGASAHSEAWLLRITNGTIDWQRRVGADQRGRVHSVARSADGGIALAGAFADEFRLVAFDANGSARWQSAPLRAESLPLRPFDIGEVQATSDGGYVVLGKGVSAVDDGSGVHRGVLIIWRLDAGGTTLWQRTYEPFSFGFQLEFPAGDSLQQTDDDGDGVRDDGYVVASGHANDSSVLFSILKLDAQGEPTWRRDHRPTAGGVRVFSSNIRVRQVVDGGYVIGSTQSGVLSPEGRGLPFGQSNVLLSKLTPTGDLSWTRVYGALLDEQLFDLQSLSDGGVLIAAASNSFGDRSEAWLLRLGADGFIREGCNAFLGSLPVAAFNSATPTVSASPAVAGAVAIGQPSVLDTAAAGIAPETIEARQCIGTANPIQAPPAGERFELTIVQPGTLQGVVISTPAGILCGTASETGCAAAFPPGDVFLAVDPSSVDMFLRWEDCQELIPVGVGPVRCRVRMDRNRTVRAVFGQARDRFRLQFTVNGTGSVTSGDEGIRCGAAFGNDQDCENLYDAVIPGSNLPNSISLGVFTHRADFTGWGGDCAAGGTARAFNLTMDADKVCSATFVGPPTSFDLSIQRTGAGSGEVISAPPGISCGTFCTAAFDANETALLLARPDSPSGSTFDGWTGCDRLRPGPPDSIPACEVDMTANRTVSAAFASGPPAPGGPTQTLRTRITFSGRGSVTTDPAGVFCSSAAGNTAACIADFAQGSTVRLIATPEPGFRFVEWRQDADCGDGVVTMDSLKSCEAVFDVDPGSPGVTPVVLNSGTTDSGTFETRMTTLIAVVDWEFGCAKTLISGAALPGQIAVTASGEHIVLDEVDVPGTVGVYDTSDIFPGGPMGWTRPCGFGRGKCNAGRGSSNHFRSQLPSRARSPISSSSRRTSITTSSSTTRRTIAGPSAMWSFHDDSTGDSTGDSTAQWRADAQIHEV